MSGTTSTGGHGAATSSDNSRWTYGLVAVGAGLATLLIGLLISVANFNNATDVTSVLGIVGTTIGTLVGAYFGVAVGSAGKEKSDAAAATAHAEASRAKDAVALMAAAGQSETVQPIVQSLIDNSHVSGT